MALTRRELLSSMALASILLVIPSKASAAQDANHRDDINQTGTTCSVIDDESISIQDRHGTWTLSTTENGPCRIVTTINPDGSQEFISYNRLSGEVYSSITCRTTNIGADPNYRDNEESRNVIDHDPPVIYNGPARKETRYVSYQKLKAIAGSASDVAGILASIASIVGFSLVGTFIVGFVSDNIGRILSALPDGDPNHGIKLNVTVTDRYAIHPVTGAHIFYDTLVTCNSVSFY